MKKTIAMLLVFMMLLAFAGCGNTSDPTAAPTAAPTEPAPTDPAPTDPAPTDPAPTDPVTVDVTGTYKGEYLKESAMAGSVLYSFELTLAAEQAYTFSSSFSMMGSLYTRTETGIYAVDGTKITFTAQAVDGEAVEGAAAVDGTIENGTVKAAFKLSAMASAAQEIEAKFVDAALAAAVGTYEGSYEKAAMGSTVVYSFALVLSEDMTYTFSSSFSAMGSEMTRTETGTFALDGTKITFTAQAVDGEAVAEPVAVDGTIENGTVKAAFKLSAMASAAQEIEATLITDEG